MPPSSPQAEFRTAEGEQDWPDDRDAPLFGDDFLKTLAYLNVVARKILSGRMKAVRRSKQKGVSVEFADHRPYAIGDDFRFIDWGVYFRTDHLFLKLFEEEEDLQIYLLVDCSGSMDFGRPYKFHYARRLAAAIGYLGLAALDRVHVIPFRGGALDPREALHLRGKGKVYRMMQFLEATRAEGGTALLSTARSFIAQKHQRGLAIIISDFFDEDGVEEAADMLRFQKFDPYLIHVISPQETNPALLGDLRLLDSETSRYREVTLTEALLRKYEETFQAHCDGIETYCRRKEVGYARCRTDLSFQDAVVEMLRRGQLMQ